MFQFFKKRLSLSVLAFALFFVASCATEIDTVAVRSGIDEAWGLLAENRFLEAQLAFSNYDKYAQFESEAKRGMALSLYAQGMTAEAVQAAIRSVQADPAAVQSAALIRWLTDGFILSDNQVVLLETVCKRMLSRNLPDWSQRAYQDVLFESYNNAPKLSPSQVTLEYKMGILRSWQLMGGWASPSGGTFDIELIEEAGTSNEPKAEWNMLLNHGRQAQWLTPKKTDPSGFVSPYAYLGGYEGRAGYAVHYARSTVEVFKDEAYTLILDAQDAQIKLWVDGELQFEQDAICSGDSLAWLPLNLTTGSHTILIKLGSLGYGASFRVSLLKDARPQETAARLALNKLLPANTLPSADPLTSQLALRFKNGKRLEDQFWLTVALGLSGRNEAGAAVAEGKWIDSGNSGSALLNWVAALSYEASGESALAQAARAQIQKGFGFSPLDEYQIMQHLNREDYDEVARCFKDSAVNVDADTLSLLDQAFRIVREDDPVEKWNLWAEYANSKSENPGLAWTIARLSDSGLFGDSILFAANHRYNATLAIRLRFDYLINRRRYTDALVWVSKIEDKFTWDGSFNISLNRAGLYANVLSFNQFLSIAKENAAEHPGYVMPLQDAIDIAATYANRLQAVSQAATPSVSATNASSTGSVYATVLSERELLGDFVRRSLDFYPDVWVLRKILQKLQDSPDIEKTYGSFDPLEIIAKSTISEDFRANDQIMIHFDDTRIFFDDGGIRRYVSKILKIVSRDGIAQDSTQFVRRMEGGNYYSVREAFILKADGRVEYALQSGSRISYPGLAVGDYLVLSYVEDGRRLSQFTDEVWSSAMLDNTFPVVSSVVRFVIPKQYEVQFAEHHFDAERITREDKEVFGAWNEYAFISKNREAMGIIFPRSNSRDRLAWVDLSTVKDWGQIAVWYNAIASGAYRLSPAIVRKAHELTAQAKDRNEAIQVLYSYAAAAVHYEDLAFMYSAHVPQPAKEVMEEGVGDCKDKSALLIALLRAVGIEASYALSAPDYKGPNTYLPSIRFSHVVVVVHPDEAHPERLILDPTGNVFTFPEPIPSLVGTYILPVAQGAEAELEAITSSMQPLSSWIVQIQLGSREDTVEGSAVLRGVHAAVLRTRLESADEQFRQEAAAVYLNDFLPGIKIKSLQVDRQTDLFRSPSLTFTGSLSSSLIPVGRGGRDFELVLPWSTVFSGDPLLLADAAERGAPHQIKHNYPFRQTFVISLPSGVQVSSLPEEKILRFGDAYARFSSVQLGNTLVLEREVYIPAMELSTANAAEFRSFIEAARKKSFERVLLSGWRM